MIGFQSTVGSHESKTYWKVPNRNQIHSIYIDDDETEDITRFLQEFLTEEFKYKRTGSKILLIFNVFFNFIVHCRILILIINLTCHVMVLSFKFY